MKLEKITIENFRCFESLTIGFEEDINVIVGINGAGKTALLDAISTALCDFTFTPFDARDWRYIHRGDKRYHYSRDSNRGAMLEVDDIHFPPYTSDRFVERKDYVSVETEGKCQSKFSWKHVYRYNPGKSDASFDSDFNVEAIHGYIDQMWNAVKSEPKSPILVPCFFQAQRRFSKSKPLGDVFNVKSERPVALSEALDAGSDYQAVFQWYYIRENAELRERARKQCADYEFPDLKAIRVALMNVVDGVERLYFDESVPPRFMVDVNKNGTIERLALDQLSDGYRNQLAMIMDFARRLAVANPCVENPLEAPGILLIDEIELHLHPKWQQTIIPNLRKAFPNTQIIVTTHSPQVLTTVDNRCIRLLNDYKIYTTDEFTKGAEAQRVLERVLGASARPPDSEIGKTLDIIFDLINKGRLDEAETKIKENDYLKTYETPLLEAETLIACKRWEQEEGA